MPNNRGFFGNFSTAATKTNLLWGGSVVITSQGSTVNVDGRRDLVKIPPLFDYPVVFALDLFGEDVSTGDPVTEDWHVMFEVIFGADKDVRTQIFPPGIHIVIAQALSVRAYRQPLPALGGEPRSCRYRAHACPMPTATPTYVYV